jgi:hypothetical protein
MTEPSDESPRPSVPPLGEDTVTDKAVRFGCGAFLGVSVMAYLLMSTPGGAGLVLVASLFVVGCGALAVAWGEPFFERMLRFIKWL